MVPAEQLLAHRAFVRRLALRLVADSSTAEDLVQQAFLVALRRPPRTDGDVRPWLARVVRSLAINRHAAEAARQERELRYGHERATPAPQHITSAAETEALLLETLRSLEPIYREVLSLRYYEGLPPRAIAARLGIAVETVRTRQKRGLQRMRERLEQRGAWALAVGLLLLRRPRSAAAAASVAVVAGLSLVLLLVVTQREANGPWGAPAHVALLAPDVEGQRELASSTRPSVDPQREPIANSTQPRVESAVSSAAPTTAGELAVDVAVTRPDGGPAAGAQIWIRRPDQACAEQVAECDATGHAQLESIPKGSWICASAEPFRESVLWKLDLPQFGLTADKRVELKLDEPLPPLEVRVEDADGRRLPEASVRIVPDRRPFPVDQDRFASHRERRIGPGEHDGAFEVRGLRSFVWVIAASAPGYADACVRRHVRAAQAAPAVVLTLGRGRELAGRLLLPDGRPAARATLHVDPGFPFEPHSVRANDAGEYELTRLPAVPLSLHAFARIDDAGFTARSSCAPDTSVWSATLTPGGLLMGEARWDDGAAYAGAEIELAQGATRVRAVTDEFGNFSIEACPQPPYQVAVARAGSAGEYECVVSVTDPLSRVRLTAARHAASIEGKLSIDESAGERTLSLWLRALDWNEDREVPLDSATRRFTVAAAPGRYELLAWEAGHVERFGLGSVELAPGRSVRSDFHVAPLGSIEVVSSDPEFRKGSLLLLHPDGRVSTWKQLAPRDAAVLATFAVPEGPYSLRFESERFVLDLDEVRAVAGVVRRAELRLGQRRKVAGELRLPAHLEAAGARPWVSIENSDGRPQFVSHFELRPRVDFETLLEDGEHVLTARLAQHEFTRTFVVDASTTNLSFSFDE
jgi:RNA polymerase sigma-70 factor (ECF subfamily)